MTARERLSLLRRGAMTQLRTLLQVVFPEFEAIFPLFTKKTPFVLLRAFPDAAGPAAAPEDEGAPGAQDREPRPARPETYERLMAAARATLGLPGAQARLRQEIGLTLERLALFERQIQALEAADGRRRSQGVPETPYLLSDPQDRARSPRRCSWARSATRRPTRAGEQILRVAGLSLVERSSGMLRGTKRISKRGRPLLRTAAYMFAVRSITKGGLFRAEYEALCASATAAPR